METLEKAKFVPKEKAVKVVNRVFDKCYADLEPLGRRPINAKDMKKALESGGVDKMAGVGAQKAAQLGGMLGKGMGGMASKAFSLW